MFYSAPLNQSLYTGASMTVSEKKAVYELPITEKYFHAAHAMHGATYFKMLDDAAYFAAASIEKDHFILTKSYNIHFRRPVGQCLLRAEGEVIEFDENEIKARSTIYNEDKKVVAYGEGVFVKGPKLLSSLEGYIS